MNKKQILRQALSEIGRKGGKASAKSLRPHSAPPARAKRARRDKRKPRS